MTPSFELCYVLFMFAGIYKADPRLSWFPIDFTLFFVLLSLIAGGVVLLRRRTPIPTLAAYSVLTYLLLVCYALLSLLWSPGSIYGQQKTLLLATLVLGSLAGAAFVIAGEPERLGRLSRALQLLSLAVAGEVVWSLTHHQFVQAGYDIAEHYLAVGRLFGVTAIVTGYRLVHREGTRFRWLLDLVLFGILLALMLALGGRGPFLALLVTLLVALASGVTWSSAEMVRVRTGAAMLGIGLVLVGVGLGLAIAAGNHELNTIRRLSLLFTESGGASAAARLYNYHSAIDVWLRSPVVGNGIGSWPMLAYHIDERNYPHNLFLECLAELGVIGFLIVSVLLAMPAAGCLRSLRSKATPGLQLTALLLLGAFLNAQVSGDMPDNRFMFAAIGLVIGALTWKPVGPGGEIDGRDAVESPEAGQLSIDTRSDP